MTTAHTELGNNVVWLSEEICNRWKLVGESPAVVDWERLTEQVGLQGCSESGISRAIFVADANIVECVVNVETDWTQVEAGVRGLVARGWAVNVLAHLSSLGSAHSSLSGSTASVQGWWTNDKQLRFSGHELA